MAQKHRAGPTVVRSPGATHQWAAQLPRSSRDLLLPQPRSRMDLTKVRACPAVALPLAAPERGMHRGRRSWGM